MFGFFKKKKGKSDAAIETAVALLQVQISLGDAEDNHEFNERIADKYSRGYIFGLCDALLQSAGINEIKGMALLTIIHIKLFGEENGANIVGQSFRDQGDSLFGKGLMRGGQELVEFSKNKTPTMGLSSYLLNGEMQ